MQIESLQIEYANKSGFSSTAFDGICHTKVLSYLSIVQAVEGSYDIQLDNGIVQNTGKCGFFIAPANVQQRIVHRADPASKKITCRWVFLKVKKNDLYHFDERYDFPTILPAAISKEMNDIFERLFDTGNVFDEYICYHQILKILSTVVNEKAQPSSPYIQQILRYIKENYQKNISVTDIACNANLSASRLFAVFKQQVGVSPIRFLNHYRLSVAAELLLGTTKSITQIAAEVGIHDSVYFNKLFKKQYQISPTEYRNLYAATAK